MKSAFAREKGLSGLSGSLDTSAKSLATELVAHQKGRIKAKPSQTYYGSLVEMINAAYGSRKNAMWALQAKPYLDSFSKGSNGKPGTGDVLNDLTSRYPTMFGLPSNTNSNSSGDTTTSQPAQTAQPAKAKNASSGWLMWGLVAAGLGGAAWYFMPDEEEKSNQ